MNASNGAWPMTTSVMYAQPSSPDPEFLAGLPRRSRLELGAYETAPRTARGHIARVLEEWSLPEFRDVAALIASELITNALQETAKVLPGQCLPPVRLWLRGGPPGVAILVWDAIAAPPVPRAAGADDESGRGLAIVADPQRRLRLLPAASQTGRDPSGKVTWS